MFRIGEFSKLTQVTIRMLRYYDEAGLLKPEQIDPQTGYRMYSVEKREIQSCRNEMHYNILIKSISECQVLSLRRIIPTYYAEGKLWQEVSSFAAKNQVTVSNNTFSIYHDKEYKEQNVDVELCVPVKKIGKNI